MTDPLFARAQLAIEESRKLQHHRRALKVEQEYEREQLRIAVSKSAMVRSESEARRDTGELAVSVISKVTCLAQSGDPGISALAPRT